MLDQIAKEYSSYMKVDVSNELNDVQEVVENLQMRLEEVTCILNMIKNENQTNLTAVTSQIESLKGAVLTITKQIETLNRLVHRVDKDVTLLETQMTKAESDFGISDVNKLKKFLKPWVNLSPPKQRSSNKRNEPFIYKKPDLFKSSDYFDKASSTSEE